MVWSLSAVPSAVPPKNVDSDEPLARSVHSTNGFRKGKSEGAPDKVLFSAFEPMKDEENPGQRVREISSDRCQHLTEDKAVQLGKQRAERRGLNFHGWAIITAKDARKSSRGVVSSPSTDQDNPAHADIKLPPNTTDDNKARKIHLVELAENSCWLDRPPSKEP